MTPAARRRGALALLALAGCGVAQQGCSPCDGSDERKRERERLYGSIDSLGARPSVSWNAARGECESRGQGLCSSEELCPTGAPFDGGVDSSDTWVPVSDGSDEWLQYGKWANSWQPGPLCSLHSVQYAPDPHPCHTHPDPERYPDAASCGHSFLYCCSGDGNDSASSAGDGEDYSLTYYDDGPEPEPEPPEPEPKGRSPFARRFGWARGGAGAAPVASLDAWVGQKCESFPNGQPDHIVETFQFTREGEIYVTTGTASGRNTYTRRGETLQHQHHAEITATLRPNGELAWSHGYGSRIENKRRVLTACSCEAVIYPDCADDTACGTLADGTSCRFVPGGRAAAPDCTCYGGNCDSCGTFSGSGGISSCLAEIDAIDVTGTCDVYLTSASGQTSGPYGTGLHGLWKTQYPNGEQIGDNAANIRCAEPSGSESSYYRSDEITSLDARAAAAAARAWVGEDGLRRRLERTIAETEARLAEERTRVRDTEARLAALRSVLDSEPG